MPAPKCIQMHFSPAEFLVKPPNRASWLSPQWLNDTADCTEFPITNSTLERSHK